MNNISLQNNETTNPPNHQPLLSISCNRLKLTAAKGDISASDPINANPTGFSE